MGKDLHYSIRPFIERALMNHSAVKSIESADSDEFYAYKIKRNFGYSDLIIVLSDDYNFNHYSYLNKPSLLNNGGFFLVAKPEGRCIERNELDDEISVGKIGRLMGALHKNDSWTYEPPKPEKKSP
jgi:hypothetical protein